MGPRILAATGGEKIILSGHRQRLTEIEVAVISYELRSLDLSSFVRLDCISGTKYNKNMLIFAGNLETAQTTDCTDNGDSY